MQPLISPVDHESRTNSYRAQDEDEAGPSERTPLIHRFPASSIPRRSPVTTAVVSILLLILVSGIIIGIYLLVIQNSSENILPPVEEPVLLVPRSQWDNTGNTPRLLTYSPFKADHLITVQTDTKECTDRDSCTALLRDMQSASGKELPYNYVLSSNGETYEALGWRKSPLYPQHKALVLAFIGNFTESRPPLAQMKAAERFFCFAESQHLLRSTYTIIGKNAKYSPKYLYQSLKGHKQWNSKYSDE